MTIEDLSLILYDTYQMDVYFPKRSILNREFEESSYSVWIIDELKDYISKSIYPRKSASLDEYIQLTTELQRKMSRYSRIRPNHKMLKQQADSSNFIFIVADTVLGDVLDLLNSMK